MENRDWLLANHITETTQGIGRTKRKPSWPSILHSIAILALALVVLYLGLR